MKNLLIVLALITPLASVAEILSGTSLRSIPSSLKTTTCFKKSLTKESLTCPKGEEIKALDNRFQTAGIFLSYIQGENEQYLTEMLETLNSISYRGIVNILFQKGSEKKYIDFIIKKKGKLKINTHSYEDTPKVSVFKWLQDGLQFAYKDNKPVVIALNSVHEFSRAYDIAADNEELYKSTLNDVHSRFSGQIASSCGLELIYKEDTLLAESRDWSSGGNFTPLPGNHWTTAANDYDFDEYPGRQETLYPDVAMGDFPYSAIFFEPAQIAFVDTVGGARNSIDTPTAYFGIGHIDESISIIPRVATNSDECDFGILYADPIAAAKITGESSRYSENDDDFYLESFIERSEFLTASVIDLSDKLESRLGCKIKAIAAPVATDIELTDYLDGNQLNGLVIQDGQKTSFLTSKVKNKKLNESFEKSLKSLSRDLSIHTIDASYYNSGTGGVHCATASIRVCKNRSN